MGGPQRLRPDRVAFGQIGGRIKDQDLVALEPFADLHAVVAIDAGFHGDAVGNAVGYGPNRGGPQRVGRHQDRVVHMAHDDIHLRGHAEQQRRIVGQADAGAITLVDGIAHGRDLFTWPSMTRSGSVGGDQVCRPSFSRGAYLIDIGSHPQRRRLADPADRIACLHHGADFTLLAQHHAVHGRADHRVLVQLLRGRQCRRALIQFRQGPLIGLTAGHIALHQGAETVHFLLPEPQQGGLLLDPRLQGRMLQADQELALLHGCAFDAGQGFDTPGNRGADLDPGHRLDGARGIDGFYGRTAGGNRHRNRDRLMRQKPRADTGKGVNDQKGQREVMQSHGP
jgi:hypothetical protein